MNDRNEKKNDTKVVTDIATINTAIVAGKQEEAEIILPL
jgi:hypothetical protein